MTRVDELTLRLLDGSLTETEHAELEALCSADPAAARAHIGLLDLEAELRGGRKRLDVSPEVLERIQRAVDARIERGVMARVRSVPRPTRARPAIARRGPVLTPRRSLAAAVLLAAAGIAWLLTSGVERAPTPRPTSPAPELSATTPPRGPDRAPALPDVPPDAAVRAPVSPAEPRPSSSPPPPSVTVERVMPPPHATAPAAPETPAGAPAMTTVAAGARIEETKGPVFVLTGTTRLAAQVKQSLPRGHGLLTPDDEGRAMVAYPDGTRLELGGRTRILNESDGAVAAAPPGPGIAVRLDHGSIAVDAARQPEGRPMVLRTDNAEVQVMGTRFTLSSRPMESTRLEVQEGRVRLTRRSDRKSVEVAAGNSAVVFAGAPLVAHAMDILPPPAPGKAWAQVFGDEFDDDRLDPSKWNVLEEARKGCLWLQRNVQLDGQGHLVVSVTRAGDRLAGGAATTAGKIEHAFGYFAARVQFPAQPGHRAEIGLAPRQPPSGGRDGALITMARKLAADDMVFHALYWGGSGTVWSQWDVPYPGLTQGWHTVGLLRTPEEYVFYMDGRVTWRTHDGAVSQAKQHWVVSDEVDDPAGAIRKAALPDRFLVDYVRVYEQVPASDGR